MSKKSTAKAIEHVAAPINFSESDSQQQLWVKIFWASLILMLGILWISGYDSGFGSDEMDMNIYGKANIAYYTSGGKDTSYLHPDHKDGVVLPATLPYYGSGFEYIASTVTAIIGDQYEYNTRHIINQLFAVIALMFTGLISARISNYKAAILSIWLIFMTPIFSGLAVFDTKDIPFLSAYIASIYFAILFIDQSPKVKWTTTLGLLFSLWLLLSIRIGGILIFGFVGLYSLLKLKSEKKLQDSFKVWGLRLAIVAALSFILMIVTWPFVLQSPIENLLKTINVVKEFPQKIILAFEGEFIDSLTLPKNYLIKMMFITIPIIVQAFVLLGLLSILLLWRKNQFKSENLLLLIACIFPVVYAIFTKMPLYNSWRHLLFIYPPLIAVTSAGLILLLKEYFPSKPIVYLLAFGIVAIGLISPAKWWIQNNPYQYTYYNEFAGPYNTAYYEYETDYWQITTKEAIDWLMKHEPIAKSKDTVTIACNAYTFSNYYVKKRYPNYKVKFQMLGEKSRISAKGIYSIFNNLFLEPHYLEYCFPSSYSIHTIDIGGMPTTYVAKDTTRYAFYGLEAFNQNQNQKADSFFNLYLQQIKYDGSFKNMIPAFSAIAYTKMYLGQYETSYNLTQKLLQAYPSDYIANITMGALYIARKDFSKALYYLQAAEQIKPNEPATRTFLQMIPKR